VQGLCIVEVVQIRTDLVSMMDAPQIEIETSIIVISRQPIVEEAFDLELVVLQQTSDSPEMILIVVGDHDGADGKMPLGVDDRLVVTQQPVAQATVGTAIDDHYSVSRLDHGGIALAHVDVEHLDERLLSQMGFLDPA
jgi:hypothetical protein